MSIGSEARGMKGRAGVYLPYASGLFSLRHSTLEGEQVLASGVGGPKSAILLRFNSSLKPENTSSTCPARMLDR